MVVISNRSMVTLMSDVAPMIEFSHYYLPAGGCGFRGKGATLGGNHGEQRRLDQVGVAAVDLASLGFSQ